MVSITTTALPGDARPWGGVYASSSRLIVRGEHPRTFPPAGRMSVLAQNILAREWPNQFGRHPKIVSYRPNNGTFVHLLHDHISGLCRFHSKSIFLFMTFDFVKVTIKSRFHVGSTINYVHYVEITRMIDRKQGCLRTRWDACVPGGEFFYFLFSFANVFYFRNTSHQLPPLVRRHPCLQSNPPPTGSRPHTSYLIPHTSYLPPHTFFLSLQRLQYNHNYMQYVKKVYFTLILNYL